ncbi:hypothetical protein [Streptomyces cinnamoneus]|uniref:Uncharacterized protein n=1 Tax=Streptomyces cinnamoneus TaxID=53446 RepID=A0A918TD96_STRCJ|nr:hypothetical protein [Streptomyces cinnamoneus]GHC40166.1 hypothetical protein GCM10010507_12800 [Streptomyces cinnamoneus]
MAAPWGGKTWRASVFEVMGHAPRFVAVPVLPIVLVAGVSSGTGGADLFGVLMALAGGMTWRYRLFSVTTPV